MWARLITLHCEQWSLWLLLSPRSNRVLFLSYKNDKYPDRRKKRYKGCVWDIWDCESQHLHHILLCQRPLSSVVSCAVSRRGGSVHQKTANKTYWRSLLRLHRSKRLKLWFVKGMDFWISMTGTAHLSMNLENVIKKAHWWCSEAVVTLPMWQLLRVTLKFTSNLGLMDSCVNKFISRWHPDKTRKKMSLFLTHEFIVQNAVKLFCSTNDSQLNFLFYHTGAVQMMPLNISATTVKFDFASQKTVVSHTRFQRKKAFFFIKKGGW